MSMRDLDKADVSLSSFVLAKQRDDTEYVKAITAHLDSILAFLDHAASPKEMERAIVLFRKWKTWLFHQFGEMYQNDIESVRMTSNFAERPGARVSRLASMGDRILLANGLVKRYGKVAALNHCDFEVRQGEILAVIGPKGAGKSTLVRTLSGAVVADAGEIVLNDERVHLRLPIDARNLGIETVYETVTMLPALSITDNMFMGREIRKAGILGSLFRQLDRKAMAKFARQYLSALGVLTIQDTEQLVETLSSAQRRGVELVRAAFFASKVLILDEPTAGLGINERQRVLDLIYDIRARGITVVVVSQEIPVVVDIANRVHIQRLGRRLCVAEAGMFDVSELMAFVSGTRTPPRELLAA